MSTQVVIIIFLALKQVPLHVSWWLWGVFTLLVLLEFKISLKWETVFDLGIMGGNINFKHLDCFSTLISNQYIWDKRLQKLQQLGPVVLRVNNAIQWINSSPADKWSKTYSIILRIEFYPVDSIIQPSNNWGLLKEMFCCR